MKTNRSFLTPQEQEEQKKKHLRMGCYFLILAVTVAWAGIIWALSVIIN